MNKYLARPQIGELSHELSAFTEITWKVSRDCILRNATHDIPSPPFTFAGATWILHVWPYGHPSPDSYGWIDLGVERLDSEVPEHNVFFKFYLKTNRGKEFEPYKQSFIFNAMCTVGWMMYTEKADLFRKEKAVVKEGILTIVCELRISKICGIEVLTHAELMEPFAGSSNEKSAQDPGSSASICNEPLEEKSRQDSVSSASVCKESPEEASKQDLESSECVCKDCDCIPHHSDNQILLDFKELLLRQEDCDVIIKVKGQEFPAHRAILRARSPVFASTFRNDMKEKATGIIDIEDCDPSSFLNFLCFLYCGSVENLTTENVYSLFTTADKYDVQNLRLQCLKFMKKNLSVDTFCDTVILAVQHLEEELISSAIDFFAKNLQEIIVTVKWQAFLVANPIQSNEIMIKALVPRKK